MVSVTYTDSRQRSASADESVETYANSDTRDLHTGLVKSTPARMGGHTWHKGGSDPNAPEHLTVEFKDASGNHITTKHIDRNGNAC